MTVTRDDPRLRPPRQRAPAPRGAAEGSGARPPAAEERNPGIPLDLDLILSIRINRSAVERRAATLPKRRTVKKDWQAAWLLRAVTCIDLTTLQGDDTPGNVLRLCAKARDPIRRDLIEALGVESLGITVGAVCVYRHPRGRGVDGVPGRAQSLPAAPRRGACVGRGRGR
jgi:deoxyribose-phosphate aldolase